jgi:plastocyanin domain-containing protein
MSLPYVTAPGRPREVKVEVTQQGFEPARVRVARDESVTLVVTRRTERTCARELVIDAYAVKVLLPLGEPVRVTITPRESGPVPFGCGMDRMVRGVVSVV